MIHKDLKIKTLYSNKKSWRETYFFLRKDDVLYGVRREKPDWEWSFGTWSSYSDPKIIEKEIEVPRGEMPKMQKAAIRGIFTK